MLANSRINLILRWIIGLLCIFLIVGVSIARIYLGTHWATDILAAYIIGFMMLAVVILLYFKGGVLNIWAGRLFGGTDMKIKKEIIRYLIVTPLVGAADFGIYFFSIHFLPHSVSKAISYIMANGVGYLFNKYWIFRRKRKQNSVPEAGRYFILDVVLLHAMS